MENKEIVIKITAGMMSDYEIVKTNAPFELWERQLRILCYMEECCQDIPSPAYEYILSKGYYIEELSNQDDNIEFDEDKIDHFLDWYDYYTE